MTMLFRTSISFAMLATAVYAQEPLPANPPLGVRELKVEEHRLGSIDRAVKFPVFSSDGCRLACVNPKGTKFRVVVDGVGGQECDEIVSWPNAFGAIGEHSLRFSPDGKRVAYVARKGAKHHLVVDGVEARGCDETIDSRRSFSPDSKRIAFAAGTGPAAARKWSVVADDVEGPRYDGIGYHTPVFSPDSK